jgi:hypothetical protein
MTADALKAARQAVQGQLSDRSSLSRAALSVSKDPIVPMTGYQMAQQAYWQVRSV